MVFAMHVLWPLLLFSIRFLVCVFYVWKTAIVVLLLIVFSIRVLLKKFHLNITANISFSKNCIKRMFHTPTEAIPAGLSFDEGRISLPGGDEISIAKPIAHSRLSIQEECGQQNSNTPTVQLGPSAAIPRNTFLGPSSVRSRTVPTVQLRPSEIPVMQPRTEPARQQGSSQTLVKQPYVSVADLKGPLDTSRIQSQLEPKNLHEASELSAMQTLVNITALYNAFQDPKIQFYLGLLKLHAESRTPTMQRRSSVFEPNRKETIHRFRNSEDLRVEDSRAYRIASSANTAAPRMATDQTKRKDFSQQVNLNGKTFKPQRNRTKGLRENGGGDQGSQSDPNEGYCERCGKKNSRPEFAYTTRSGTVFGPANVFCHCISV